MTFRPTLWATVAALVALVVLIGLGTWQLDRRAWKEQIIETRAERIAAPALRDAELAAASEATLDAIEYRPIRLSGRFDGRHSLKLLSRTRDGRPGFHVITPLVTDHGLTILVDRGWVPVGRDGDITPPPTDPVFIEGYVRRFVPPGRFTPDNNPAADAWYFLDRDQIASATGLTALAPFYVQQAPDAAVAERHPVGAVPSVALPNPHLQYAITWYALAVVLLVIYVIFHVRRRAGEDE